MFNRSFKVLLLSITLILPEYIFSQICNKSQLPSNLQNGLVAFYPFCGNANDVGGNSFNGTITNGAVPFVNDRFGNATSAVQLGGGYIVTNTGAFNYQQNQTFTISIWFTLETNSSGGRLLSTECPEGNFRMATYGNGDYGVQYGDYIDDNVLLNTWTHLVYTYDNRSEKVYINGVLKYNKIEATNLTFTHCPLTIGAKASASFDRWTGKVDDLIVYDRVLSACEVSQIYNTTSGNIPQVETFAFNSLADSIKICGKSTTLDAGIGFNSYSWNTGATTQSISPISSGFYKVNVTNSSGCIATDSTYLNLVNANIIQRDTTICKGASIVLNLDSIASGAIICDASRLSADMMNGLIAYYPFCGNANNALGTGNNGTIFNAGLTSDRFGNSNSAYSFNGTNAYIDFGANSAIGPTTTIPVSISIWVSGGASGNVLSKYTNLDAPKSYFLFGRTANGYSWIGNGVNPYIQNAGVSDTEWTHYVLVGVSGTSNSKVYRNGILIASGTLAMNTTMQAVSLVVGKVGASFPGFLKGEVDDILIYNRILNPAEIQNLYQKKSATSWSTGATSNSITVTPTQTTKYYVTVSDGITSCRDSITVTVASVDTALTVLDNPAICSNGGTVRIQAKAGASAYQWKRNGVSIAGANSALFTATLTGNYHVVITGTGGCVDSSRIVSIITSPVPVPNFTINSINQCLSVNNFTFTNSTTVSSGTMSYSWNFGNGNTSTAISPSYTYPAAGSYTVKLVANSDKNCIDSISKSITIYPKADTTLTLLDAVASCANVGTRMMLNNNSSYTWLKNGNVINGATSIQYKATTTGIYRAVVTSGDGCSDTTRQEAIIINPLPVSNFTISNPSQCLNENNFIFTNTSTISSVSMVHAWNFGDGSSSTSISPSKKYSRSGTYTIKLVSTSNNLCVDSISKQITVLGDADSSISVLDPAEVCSTGGSVRIQAGNAASYSWIKDGIVLNGSTASLFSATQSGNYQVIVRSSEGCADTSKIVSIVLNPQPVANFTINSIAQCLTENGFNFTNSSTISAGPMNYAWTLGDGTTAISINASRTYTTAGTYNIKLVATSNKLCKDSITKAIIVYPQPQIPVITGPNEFCKGSNINLQTTGSPVLTWFKNDNLLAGETLNTFLVNQGGDYKVVSTDNNGCKSSSVIKTVIENLLPLGTFNKPSTLNICDGSSVTLSASGASTYQWFYNTNPILGATKATYNATAAGTYSVDFISNKGCFAKGTTTYTLVLLKKPVANYIYDTYCAGIQTNFSSKSIVAQSGLVRYFWQFGDGKVSSNGQNAFNTYATAGNYRAKLVVTPVECPQLADSITVLIPVETPPSGLKYPPVNAIINRAQQLSARNIGITYQWTPASYLSSFTSRTPTITTSKEQQYLIYINNQAGCNIVDTQLVRVFPDRNIYVPEGFTPDNDGHNDRLYPILVGISEMKVFKIFNRWGTLVFDNKSATVNTGWNGAYLGRTQPMDSYVWIAEGIDVDGKRITRTGNTILIR